MIPAINFITSTTTCWRVTSVCSPSCTSPTTTDVGVIEKWLGLLNAETWRSAYMTSAELGAVAATMSVFVNPITACDRAQCGRVGCGSTRGDHEEKLSQGGGGLSICLHRLPERVESIERMSSRKRVSRGYSALELNRLDDLVTDVCPPIPDKLSRKYYRKFKVDFPGPCLDVAPPPVVRETLI